MSDTPKGKRTTVSLTEVVANMADESMKEDGYENFSAYVAELIRRDYKGRTKPKPAKLPEPPANLSLNEKPTTYGPASERFKKKSLNPNGNE